MVEIVGNIFLIYRRSFLGVTAHWVDSDTTKICARKSAALACRRLIGSHTADLILHEIESVLQSFEIMDKVTKIVTDGGSNFVCALKSRPPVDSFGLNEGNLGSESAPMAILSLRDILDSYTGNAYPVRPHQICASHRFNNVMSSDIENARKKIQQSHGDGNEQTELGESFFEWYDLIMRDCQKIWNKQQRSTVSY